MNRRYAVVGLSLALCALSAQAQQPLPVLDKQLAGPRTQVLVLGSTHLSQIKQPIAPRQLEPVLDRLAAFKPDIITVESLGGEQCDLMARHPTVYAPADVEQYCVDTAPAKAATGLDVPTAIAAFHKTLREWPARPTPAQRRQLAAQFLAAGEHPSALVQWLQLADGERRTGDGLDTALVARLEKLGASNNESYSVGARLAARLGLQRVYNVDDHTGDNIAIDDIKAFGAAVQGAWDAAAGKAREVRARQEELTRSGDLLALYRYINRPEVQRIAIESDFGAAVSEASPQRYGRLYVSGWEARNLRMVANIRVAFGNKPGGRVLSIVGSSHKPWFDGLLGQMQGVDVVDAVETLK
ncbi:DUF5694 domain-containing protein [Tahibacter harae]|uniref:DUF5694 domain-containing protein n=1 Tax=Tahibacter harae TaxID=2963937 RepID=A0ABT1QNE0_9GAMM|nr:DUF5694 domain-containing protein [Tahibacter harae]MCQ4163565.1 DUF5694 domain-containing protein [Tahibacter harae]